MSKTVNITYGKVAYRHEVPPVPETSRVEGNVTIKNVAQPGIPAYFQVDFRLDCEFDKDEPLGVSNSIFWTVNVTGLGPDASYKDIEAKASEQIVPMLRDVAEILEKKSPA